MPTFYLHLDECGDVTPDPEGVDRPSLADARLDAIVAARSIMRDELTVGRLCLSCRIDITDDTGAILAVVPFTDAVTITGL